MTSSSQAASTHVATLFCDTSFPALAERHLARVSEVLHASEVLEAPQEPAWLDKGIAADISFAPAGALDCRTMAEKLRGAIADPQIDVIVQPIEGRRKKLLFAEMDKVLIGQNTLDEIASVIGCAPQHNEIRAKVANGEISYAAGLREIFAFLQTRRTDCLSHVLGKKMAMTPGARVLVETMRAHGATVALATFGFSCFAGLVAGKAGITEVIANKLILENDKIAALAEPVLDPAGKMVFLESLLVAQAIARSDVLMVVHDAADLPLLDHVGCGIAFRAEAPVTDAATARIDRGDLSGLLYIQGYRREDFVTESSRPLDASDWKRKYGGYEKAHERTRL